MSHKGQVALFSVIFLIIGIWAGKTNFWGLSKPKMS